MPSRWKPPQEERTDPEVVRRKKELGKKPPDMVEYGNEEDFVAAVKAYKPNIGKDELRALIMRFRDAVREKRGLY